MKPTLVYLVCFLATAFAGCSSADESTKTVPPPLPAPAAPASPFDGYQVIQVADGGSISGTISVSGTIPKLPVRPLNKDPKICGTGTRESQQLVVSRSGALQNAVVIVQDVKSGKALPAGAQAATIDQKSCDYTPHVMIVPVKTEVSVLNSDPILHNIHMYQNQESLFNIAQPAQNQINKYTLDKAGFILAECDVHGWMRAHVAVVDNPYYAVTDENGKFSIADLPAGVYKVKVWHEYLGEKTQDVTVAAKTESAFNVDLKDLLDAKRPAAITAAPAAGTPAPAAAAPGAPAKAPAGASAREVTVQMLSEGTAFRYEPPNLTVKVGTTVKWVNGSDNRHTATADPRFEKKAGQAVLPAGVDPWSSPFLPNGEAFTRTFTVPGTYAYFCRNHEQFGMVGKVTVVP